MEVGGRKVEVAVGGRKGEGEEGGGGGGKRPIVGSGIGTITSYSSALTCHFISIDEKGRRSGGNIVVSMPLM